MEGDALGRLWKAMRWDARVAAGSAVLSALMVPATTSLRFTRGPHRPRAIGRNQEHCEAEMPPCYRIFNQWRLNSF